MAQKCLTVPRTRTPARHDANQAEAQGPCVAKNGMPLPMCFEALPGLSGDRLEWTLCGEWRNSHAHVAFDDMCRAACLEMLRPPGTCSQVQRTASSRSAYFSCFCPCLFLFSPYFFSLFFLLPFLSFFLTRSQMDFTVGGMGNFVAEVWTGDANFIPPFCQSHNSL